MSSDADGALLLSPDLVTFMLGPVAIKVGSCSAEHVPSVAQGYGCRLSPETGEVCVFLSESRSAGVLRDLRDGGAFAAVFSRPATHRTVQLKSPVVRIEPPQPGDAALIQRHGQRTTGELVSLGYPQAFSRALMAPGIADAVCVCFVPVAAFDQTPGEDAGKALAGAP